MLGWCGVRKRDMEKREGIETAIRGGHWWFVPMHREFDGGWDRSFSTRNVYSGLRFVCCLVFHGRVGKVDDFDIIGATLVVVVRCRCIRVGGWTVIRGVRTFSFVDSTAISGVWVVSGPAIFTTQSLPAGGLDLVDFIIGSK